MPRIDFGSDGRIDLGQHIAASYKKLQPAALPQKGVSSCMRLAKLEACSPLATVRQCIPFAARQSARQLARAQPAQFGVGADTSRLMASDCATDTLSTKPGITSMKVGSNRDVAGARFGPASFSMGRPCAVGPTTAAPSALSSRQTATAPMLSSTLTIGESLASSSAARGAKPPRVRSGAWTRRELHHTSTAESPRAEVAGCCFSKRARNDSSNSTAVWPWARPPSSGF